MIPAATGPPPAAPRGRLDRLFDAASARGWRLLVLAAVVWLGMSLVARLYLVVVPLLAATVLATLFVPPTRWLRRHGVPRSLAAVVTVVGGVVGGLSVLAVVLNVFVQQGDQFGQTLLTARSQIVGWLRQGPLELSSQQVAQLVNQVSEELRARAGMLVSGVFASALLAVEIITAALLTVALCYFLVRDGDRIAAWGLARVPAHKQELVRASGRRAWDTLTAYVRGVVVIAVIDTVGIATGLVLLGVPFAFPLAVLVFFGAFFPIVGAFVSGLAAVLVALVTLGPTMALVVLGIVIAVQQFEGNVLQPVVMGRAVPLHPVVVLLAVTAGGLLGGIAGLAFAVPIAACLSAVGNEWRKRTSSQPDPDHGRAPVGNAAQAVRPGVRT